MGFTSALVDSLNKDSGVIVAMATATSAAATVVLIFWTIKYVRLTRSLVATTAEHMQHTIREEKEKLDANRQGLHELTKIILTTLNKLPTSREKMKNMAGLILWTEEDLLDMRHLARGLSGKVIGNVFWAIYHLNRIGKWTHDARQGRLEEGSDLTQFPWENYAGTLQQVKQELSHLLELL